MAKKEYPWFPIYAAEMLADGRFQGWTLEERGAWVTLLCYCWNDGSIPSGMTALGRLLHVETADVSRIWSAIGDRFVEVPGTTDRVTSPRLEAERDKARLLSKRRAEAGLEGAKGRWGANAKQDDSKGIRLPSEPHGNRTANGCPVQSQSPSQSPTASKLPTRGEREDERWPLSCSLSARLGEVWGSCPSLPRGEQGRNRFEADVRRLGLDRATDVCLDDAEESIRKGKITHPPESLGWCARALERARALPEAPAEPKLPGPAADWFSSMPPQARACAEARWAETVERIKHAAYPDALPRLLEAEARTFMAEWDAGIEAQA